MGVLERMYELYLDIVSKLSFGQSFHCLGGKTSTAYRDVQAFFTVVPAIPNFLSRYFGKVLRVSGDFKNSVGRIWLLIWPGRLNSPTSASMDGFYSILHCRLMPKLGQGRRRTSLHRMRSYSSLLAPARYR